MLCVVGAGGPLVAGLAVLQRNVANSTQEILKGLQHILLLNH